MPDKLSYLPNPEFEPDAWGNLWLQYPTAWNSIVNAYASKLIEVCAAPSPVEDLTNAVPDAVRQLFPCDVEGCQDFRLAIPKP